MKALSNSQLLFFAWIVAAVATLGSLFFSEVVGFVPCSLCWYQRVFMYPIVLTLGVGLFQGDDSCVKYSYPLSIVGFAIALYQNLLQWGILPESAAPCKVGVPCSAKYINWAGFVTIPFLSLVAFLLIFMGLFILRKRIKGVGVE